MTVSISFKQMDSSDALKEFITEKSQPLSKYFQGQLSVTWVLTTEKLNRIAHCHVVGNHMDYFGQAEAEDFKSSIELAIHKIEKQIRKHKEIVKDHLHSHQTPRPLAAL